jgi:GTPase SAR1 family protein
VPIELAKLIDGIQPERTVLMFGAGSSVPSGAPTGTQLSKHLADTFGILDFGYSLSEISSLVEQKTSRSELIAALRERFRSVRPTGGLLNLALYDWKSLYTTNYDNLIEQCYERQKRDITVYSSDFDFTVHDVPTATKLFKLHGTIEKDICDGNASRIIITDGDYDATINFREGLYDRLKGDIVGSHMLIIGHSLQDADIKDIANRAATLAAKTLGAWRISLLLYERDENRAQLFERRSFSVCFGGIDDFFSALARKLPRTLAPIVSANPLDAVPALRPITLDVEHATNLIPDLSAMFNGWPATHADIAAGLTFERTIAEEVEQYLTGPDALCAILLGASGVGKTTAARQIVQHLRRRGYSGWEHQTDHNLNVRGWLDIAKHLKTESRTGVLLIDEAHSHLQEINDLVDALALEDIRNVKLIAISTRNHWNPRIKTPYIFQRGKEFKLGQLSHPEIDRLLNLVEANAEIRALVEHTFSGFSRYERRRRLIDRCEGEMFVCLKNIFASEKFDDIILREYAGLAGPYQDIYRHVAAMESAGIHVHRQLVIRILGIPATEIPSVLLHLTDIVHEYTINEREGIYGWRGRHAVIVSIIARYKYSDADKIAGLFAKVIDNISPTYDIEVRSIRELCNLETGIPSIPDKQVQNRLLRKMMSVVPGERVPRHRLIRNLIKMGELEKAETEIRIFDKDFGRDGPVARYKVDLLTVRATNTPGIMEEDRLAILEQARAMAEHSIKRYPNNKALLTSYCNVGVEVHRRTGRYDVYDAAMTELKAAEERIGDPEIGRLIARYEARFHARASEPIDVIEDPD